MGTSGKNKILLKYQNVRRKNYKKWCVYYQVQRYELVDYVSADLEISDELYEKIQENIENGIPVHSGEVGEELEKLAQKHYENYVTQFACDDYDMPWRGDYDSDEAYEKALEEDRRYFFEDDPDATEEEYEEHLQEFREACKWHIEDDLYEDFTFDDPGEATRFAKCLSDIQCKRYSGENTGSHYFEFQDYDDEIINYSLWITFDENGFVINVSDIDAQSGAPSFGWRMTMISA